MKARTIWDRDLLAEVPRRYRGLYTVVLPLKYATIAMFALLTLLARYPGIVANISSPQYSDLWTLTVGVLAALAGLGLIFRLERLEAAATLLLCAGLLTYPVAAVIVGWQRGDLRIIGLGFALAQLVYLPGWRIFDIARTARRRDGARPRRQH